jgi:tRNA threonylcarbamoyladenosine biosynthesis protein TsaB
MKILAFDTTNSLASVAIVDKGKLLSFQITKEASNQAEMLFKLIKDALLESNLKLEDINLVSVTNGPGSFTGVRVGLAAALGMEMNINAKLIALSNFQVLAYSKKESINDIAVIVDARREQVYLQLFNSKLRSITEPALISCKDISLSKDISIIGDGFEQENKDLMINVDAKLLAQASEFYFDQDLYSDIAPLYIREPDIGKKIP